MQKHTKKSGLPEGIKLKHDIHFVDFISSRQAGPNVRMIPIVKIDPNPRQPRSELGEIKELMASIKEKGVLEPILVRPKENRYEIIAGERRFIASKKVGLKEMPCIEMDVEDNEAMEISLVENLQRKDLDVFEEADGLYALAEIYGYNHHQIAEKLGKARSTVTEILSLSKIPENIRSFCLKNNITSRGMLIEISKQKTAKDMLSLAKQIHERELRRDDTRDLSKQLKGKGKRLPHFVYSYKPVGDESFRLRIEFKKPEVEKEEIIKILEEVLKKLSGQRV